MFFIQMLTRINLIKEQVFNWPIFIWQWACTEQRLQTA